MKLNDEQAKRIVKRVSQHYLQEGKRSWARVTVITMRGFYEAHNRELKFKRSEKLNAGPKKKIGIEYIPSKLDVYRMADSAISVRNRVLILCLFQSGVRVGCLCKWTFGVVADQLYPELQVPVEIKVTQEMDSKLGSYGLGYYVTFLGEEAAQGLKEGYGSRVEFSFGGVSVHTLEPAIARADPAFATAITQNDINAINSDVNQCPSSYSHYYWTDNANNTNPDECVHPDDVAYGQNYLYSMFPDASSSDVPVNFLGTLAFAEGEAPTQRASNVTVAVIGNLHTDSPHILEALFS